MPRLDPALRHAITPPAFTRTTLHRERLVDVLHANLPRKLIAIAAPAGYGKTTLLSDFNAHTNVPVCWLRITEADRDEMRLATLVYASLSKRFRRLKKKLRLQNHVGATPQALAIALADLIDSHISESFVVILDDVHILNSSDPALKLLDALLDSIPGSVTLIASGREVLEISLAKLMAEGNLFGIGPHDLALSRSELTELAQKQLGRQLGERELEQLYEDTRGWITGVVLSAELSGPGLGGELRRNRAMVYEYLASVVLNRLPDDLRRFALDSSVMPIMNAAACDKVLGRSDSQRNLTNLVRRGLFIVSTDESPRSYEYHPQFRQFLLESLGTADPRRLRSLRKRTADYFAKIGRASEAVALYFEADASRRAAQLADMYSQEMYEAGRYQTLEYWGSKVRASRTNAPRVFLSLAKVSIFRHGDLEKAQLHLDNARGIVSQNSRTDLDAEYGVIKAWLDYSKGDYQKARAIAKKARDFARRQKAGKQEAAATRILALAEFGLRNDLAHAEELAQKAVKLSEEAGVTYDFVNALSDLSTIQTGLGKTIEAYNTSLKAHSILKDLGSPLPLSISCNNLAVDLYLQGRYLEALEYFNEGMKFARQAASPLREANIIFGQADVFCDLGLSRQAGQLYEEGLTIAMRIDSLRLIRYGCLQTSILHRRWGRGSLAHEWLRRCIALGQGTTDDAADFGTRVQLAALESEVSPERAVTALNEILESPNLDAMERTSALFFLSRAHYQAGDKDRAQSQLLKAFDYAGASGTEQIIAAELRSDRSYGEFVRRDDTGNPVYASIDTRIQTMKLVTQHYGESEPTEYRSASTLLKGMGITRIERDGTSIDDLKPQAKELAFYLAHFKQSDKDSIVEEFWPHLPPGRQVANLHMTIYSLRRVLGKEMILLDGPTYAVARDASIVYDVDNFERAAGIAERLPPGDPRRYFALTEAINAYGGPYLPEFASQWVITVRRRLELRYLDLLADHADEALVRDQPMNAVRTLRQALEIDPYRDDFNFALLECLGRLDRRSEIVTHYQQYVRLLADELGLDPPERIRDLYRRLIG